MSAPKSIERVKEVEQLRDLIRSCDSDLKREILVHTAVGIGFNHTYQKFFETLPESWFNDVAQTAKTMAEKGNNNGEC